MRRAGLWIAIVCSACQPEAAKPGELYFDRVIAPILTQSCARGTSGCHAADPQDPLGFAAGNLDLTTFENVKRRPDVLRTSGASPVPLLLAKAVGETTELKIVYRGRELPLAIPHAGGAVLQVGSPAFLTLQTWLDNGATRDGIRPQPGPVLGTTPCSTAIPTDFDEAALTATPQWQKAAGSFDAVQQILSDATCNAGNCHGAPLSDFYLTCGSDAHQKAFNFRQVWAFVGSPPEGSEILVRATVGGVPHTGGGHFTSRDDPRYQTIVDFATELLAVGPLEPQTDTAGRQFFVDNVLPALLARGCGVEGCHSPAAMNDFKLRSGMLGFVSALEIDKDYRMIKDDFMAFEVPDVRRGRLVAKNVFPEHGGIAHRGGALLEAGGADPAACPTPYVADGASPFCTLVEWARIERGEMTPPNPNAGPIPTVWVERAAPAHSLLEFQTHEGNSDLAAGTYDGAAIMRTRSLLDGCGVDKNSADVRAPDVRYDGRTVVFAMRPNAGAHLQLWTVQIDGSDCKSLLADDADNFDPAWARDGQWILFASTRAGGTTRRLGLAQSDIWRVRADGTGAERLTFLSNSEIGPQMMREGRIIMTTEKVDARDPHNGFYQLAGRRLNWDGTDYHPLLAQRALSPVDPTMPQDTKPSVGFQQATEIREGLDGNFLLIASNPPGPMAGSLATFNRSVGPFERDRTDKGFLASMRFFDGSYRSPFPLPDGRIMASQLAGGRFDLVAIDPATGTVAPLMTGNSRSVLEAVLAYAYPPSSGFYDNRRQLVFGGSVDPNDLAHAIVHFTDAPMLATLLGANLRLGRHPDGFRDANQVGFLDRDGNLVGTAPLAADGSARVRAPAGTPIYIGLFKDGAPLFVMSEEHQLGPGERISLGVRQPLFDHVCAGCHGSVSGSDLDISVTPDVLTGASQSLSADATPTQVGP